MSRPMQVVRHIAALPSIHHHNHPSYVKMDELDECLLAELPPPPTLNHLQFLHSSPDSPSMRCVPESASVMHLWYDLGDPEPAPYPNC